MLMRFAKCFIKFYMFRSTEPIFLVCSKLSRLAQAILNMICVDVLTDMKYSICSRSYSSTKADVTRKTCCKFSLKVLCNSVEDVSFLITIYKEISGTLMLKNFSALKGIL